MKKHKKPLDFNEWLEAYKGYEYIYFKGLSRCIQTDIKIEYGNYRKKFFNGEVSI